VTDPTRREFLGWGGALTLVGGSGLVGEVLAACGSGSSGPSGETTWQRVMRTKTVVIGLANENPAAFINGTNADGQAPSVAKAVLALSGVTNLNATVTEFDSLIPGLVAKRFDMIGAGMFVRPARCKQIAFAEPDGSVPDYALVRKGNPKGIHKANDIAIMKVKFAVQTGAFEQTFAQQIGVSADNLIVVPTQQDQVASVLSGRADVTMFNKPALTLVVAQHPNDLEIAEPWTPPLDASGKPFPAWSAEGFRKEDSDFLSAFNSGLAQLKANGTLTQIDNKWGYDPPNADTPTTSAICSGS